MNDSHERKTSEHWKWTQHPGGKRCWSKPHGHQHGPLPQSLRFLMFNSRYMYLILASIGYPWCINDIIAPPPTAHSANLRLRQTEIEVQLMLQLMFSNVKKTRPQSFTTSRSRCRACSVASGCSACCCRNRHDGWSPSTSTPRPNRW